MSHAPLDFIQPDAVICDLRASSKKQVLQDLTLRAAELTGLEPNQIFDVVLDRERLGSTGVGDGIAIPHGRIAALDRVIGVFAKLDRAIDFDSIDGQPVDLVVLLLAPDCSGTHHLQALAKVSRTFNDHALCDRLRGSLNAEAAAALLCNGQSADAPPPASTPTSKAA